MKTFIEVGSVGRGSVGNVMGIARAALCVDHILSVEAKDDSSVYITMTNGNVFEVLEPFDSILKICEHAGD